MLDQKEFRMLSEAVASIDAQLTDDIIENAEYFDIEEDVVTMKTIVTLYDANGGVVGTVEVEDYDYALAYMEEHFDLDWNDPEESDPEAAAGNSRFGHAS